MPQLSGQVQPIKNVPRVLAAVAFSIAHVSGLPARVAPGISVVFAEMLVGLILGALFLWSGNIVVPFVSSIVYFISTFFIQRRSLFGVAKLSEDSNS